jgi:regulator of protease activity HflC (stomatin/prohibitin superfamily)
MITERPHSRARNVALIGLAFQVLLTAFLVIMKTWTLSEALRGLMLLSACGIPIWLYLLLVYQQRILVQEEEMETEELRSERQSGETDGTIFDQESLLLAQRRLRWMYRWLLPVVTILVVLGLLVAGQLFWPWSLGTSIRAPLWPKIATENATLAIWFIAGAALVTFLLSRYASGLARYPEWRMLRSGASWLMGVTLGLVAVAITLAPLHYYEMNGPERVVAYVVRILLLVLAVEILFNFVLDFYRPRKPDDEPRPAFDSRLLGLFSEPGGIARSIADAVNYQFGFEVSSTWLYKLLERAALPLAGFAVLVLFLASSFVIVQADQEVVIEHFGRPTATRGPGLHVKLPWPFETAEKVSTQQIHQFALGSSVEDEGGKKEENPLILWTNKHEQEPHLKVLIATPQLASYLPSFSATQPEGLSKEARSDVGEGPIFADAGQAVSVSILRVAMAIQYKINDARQWIATYADPEAMLKAIASYELTQMCASQTVEGMLGEGRGVLEKHLRERIEAAAAQASLGIQIEFLGLQGIHPPEDTAPEFQDVIGAEQKRTASINSAKADYNKRLSEVAGDVDRAKALAAAIQKMNELEGDTSATPQARMEMRGLCRTLFFGDSKTGVSPIGGQASGIIAKARAERWKLENEAHAQATLFAASRTTKDAAPRVFYLREKLNALAGAVSGIRKYVIAAKGNVKVGTYHLNLQEPTDAPLDFKAGND